jgi:hypothetical protein
VDYIRAQFAARFPDADIAVTFTADETIVVRVDGDLWTMEIGSDDDKFLFTREGDVINLPLDDAPQDPPRTKGALDGLDGPSRQRRDTSIIVPRTRPTARRILWKICPRSC